MIQIKHEDFIGDYCCPQRLSFTRPIRYPLSVTGPKMPADLASPDMEKTETGKAQIISWMWPTRE